MSVQNIHFRRPPPLSKSVHINIFKIDIKGAMKMIDKK